jgi:formylglycine-generating enzyme required for sulfatase activity
MKLRRTYKKRERYWNRVVRGGYWYNYASSLRAADRYSYSPSIQSYSIGARLSKPKGGKDES